VMTAVSQDPVLMELPHLPGKYVALDLPVMA